MIKDLLSDVNQKQKGEIVRITQAAKVSEQIATTLPNQLLTFQLKFGLNSQKSNAEYYWIVKRTKEFSENVCEVKMFI